MTSYTPKPGFDYSNDEHRNGKDSDKAVPAARRGSSDRNSFDPGALAGRAAKNIQGAFESIRSAATPGSSSKTPAKPQAAPHHFTMQDSWSSPMQSNGVDGVDGGSVASSTPSSVSSSSVDGNTPQKKGPVVIPRASRADRASIEEQIRSQHREFDVDRYSGSVSSTSSRRGGGGTYNRRAGSEVYTSNSRSRWPQAAATSSSRGGDGSPRRQTVGGNFRTRRAQSYAFTYGGC